jgi:hypothetical protein
VSLELQRVAVTARFTWYEVELHYPETGWVRDAHQRYTGQHQAELAAPPRVRARVVRVTQEREIVKVLPLGR